MTFKKEVLLERIPEMMERYGGRMNRAREDMAGLNYGELKCRILNDKIENARASLSELEMMKNALHWTDSTDIPLTFEQANLIFTCPSD